MQYMFENKGKWIKQIKESVYIDEPDDISDLYGKIYRQLTVTNEGRYIDPKNLNKYDLRDIEKDPKTGKYRKKKNPDGTYVNHALGDKYQEILGAMAKVTADKLDIHNRLNNI